MLPYIDVEKGKRSVTNIILTYLEVRKTGVVEVADLNTIHLTFFSTLGLVVYLGFRMVQVGILVINKDIDIFTIATTLITVVFTIGTVGLTKTVITNSLDLILTKMHRRNTKEWIGLKVT